MKLAAVTFRINTGMPDTGWYADYVKRVVRHGLEVVPFEAVAKMTEEAPVLPPSGVQPAAATLACPECSKPFATPTALGAHRRHKHGKKGESPGRGEP